MHTENAILIGADPGAIFPLAAAVERWPALLPHYRFVRVYRTAGNRRLVEMAAWRDAIPVHWWAVEDLFPETPRITFRHVRGITTGMEVEWSFTATPGGTLVAIRHELRLAWPLIGQAVADRIIGPLFVEDIASKTLRRLKQIAEQSGRRTEGAGARGMEPVDRSRPAGRGDDVFLPRGR